MELLKPSMFFFSNLPVALFHVWYQLGSLYSNNCKSQSDFMSKLCELSNEYKEIINVMLLTHNTHKRI